MSKMLVLIGRLVGCLDLPDGCLVRTSAAARFCDAVLERDVLDATAVESQLKTSLADLKQQGDALEDEAKSSKKNSTVISSLAKAEPAVKLVATVVSAVPLVRDVAGPLFKGMGMLCGAATRAKKQPKKAARLLAKCQLTVWMLTADVGNPK